MSKINTEVLPFNPFAKPDKAEIKPPVAKWKHELPTEKRQAQESPLKRWYLEEEAKNSINYPCKTNTANPHGLFSEKTMIGGGVIKNLSESLKLR